MVINGKYFSNTNKISNSQHTTDTRTQHTQKHNEVQGNFSQVLRQKIDENSRVKFSKHAEMRLRLRNIRLSEEQLDKINEAITKAEKKV